MSVVFVVGSEEQLSIGVPWCKELSQPNGSAVEVVVLGIDRKTLAEFARRKLSEQLSLPSDKIKVTLVEHDSTSVLKHTRSAAGKTLLIIHRSDDAAFQRRLFEKSMVATMWLRASQAPPSEPFEVVAMFRRPSLFTTLACEQLLGIAPTTTLCENVDLKADDLAALAQAAIESNAGDPSPLVICGIDDIDASSRVYQAGLSLLESSSPAPIALVHTGESLAESIASKIRHWAASVAPPMERDQRIELSQDLQTGSKLNLEFIGLISASSMLAAFGLLQDSAAVIIGAMLIAPLMTPILGAGLALTQGNRPLFQSALATIALGFVCGLTASVLFGWLFWMFQEPRITGEMWARCRPSPLDFCVGLVGGIAASYARTRSHLSSALAGAAIAAALVPPIATAGLQIAFGNFHESSDGIPVVGPLLLVFVNVLTIMIGSSFVLWARGMRIERGKAYKDRWVLRILALLSMLVLLILIWTLKPFSAA